VLLVTRISTIVILGLLSKCVLILSVLIWVSDSAVAVRLKVFALVVLFLAGLLRKVTYRVGLHFRSLISLLVAAAHRIVTHDLE
jgi:hypothetical protein